MYKYKEYMKIVQFGTTRKLYHAMFLSSDRCQMPTYRVAHVPGASLHFNVYFAHYPAIYVKMSPYLQFYLT